MKRTHAFLSTFLKTRVDSDYYEVDNIVEIFLDKITSNIQLQSFHTMDNVLLNHFESLSSKRLVSLFETVINEDI